MCLFSVRLDMSKLIRTDCVPAQTTTRDINAFRKRAWLLLTNVSRNNKDTIERGVVNQACVLTLSVSTADMGTNRIQSHSAHKAAVGSHVAALAR